MARYNVSYIASFPDQPMPGSRRAATVIVRTDRTGRWRSKAVNPHFESDFVRVSRGDFPGKRPVFEQALAHFKTAWAGPAAETLWTQRGRDVALAMSGEEPRGFSLDHPGFGGLTFQRPPLGAGDPITGFAADGLPVFGVHVLPGTIRAVDYDHFPVSGEGRTYHDLVAGNAGAPLYRARRRRHRLRRRGPPVLSSLEPGEWLTYTVTSRPPATTAIDVRYAATGANAAIRIGFGGYRRHRRRRATVARGGAWRTATVAAASR